MAQGQCGYSDGIPGGSACFAPYSDQAYLLALVVILFNRFLDGLDGAIARRDGISDFGGFLDICCDFIFYSAVVFDLPWPIRNKMPGGIISDLFMLEPEPVFWPTRSWPPKGKCNPIPMEPRPLSILVD